MPVLGTSSEVAAQPAAGPRRLGDQTFSWEHLRLKICATKLQTAEIVRQDGTRGWVTVERYPDTLHSPTLAVKA